MTDVRVIQGECRDVLRELPAESVHCVVTSPPYHGLRDYGLPPTIWDPGEGCEHAWGEELVLPQRGQVGQRSTGSQRPDSEDGPQEARQGAFCRRCSAWRGSLGLEPTTPELYVAHIVEVFREVKKVLRADGTLWLNLGDSYAGSGKGLYGDGLSHGTDGIKQKTNAGSIGVPATFGAKRKASQADVDVSGWTTRSSEVRSPSVDGLKAKDLCGMPWRVAFALQADGWWLRSEIVWAKPNPMPESVTDRPTRSHEYLFLLAKAECYYYDAEAIREPWVDRPNDIARAADGRYRYNGKHGDGYANASGRNDHRSATATGQPIGDPTRGRNKRSVWAIATQPFGWEMCGGCQTVYSARECRKLRTGSMPRCNHEVAEDEPCGGIQWLAQDGGAVCAACETFYSAKALERLPRAARCRSCGSDDKWLGHFATFPEALVTPPILAGTSERGCCPECGAPWERVVDGATGGSKGKSWHSHSNDAYMGNAKTAKSDGYQARKTVGWRPTCTHEAEPVPCVILDPFAGAGTVGVVARKLGRAAVLIELSPDYCALARARIERAQPALVGGAT